MRTLLILIILFNNLGRIWAQNLVWDGGMDNNFSCPSTCGVYNFYLNQNIYFWKSNNVSTYNHFCGDTVVCPYYLWDGVPKNSFGYQYPLSDSGYAAVYANWGFLASFQRGFVYQKMRQNLNIGHKYWVEYYTSLGDSSNYAVRSMGATFCMDTLPYHLPDNTARFNRPFKMENEGEFLTDKVNWKQLHWIYEADSTYQTFLMGYAKDVPGFVGDTVFVNSECNWCNEGDKWSVYYLENAGVFPIISNNQTLQVCNFPQTLQGTVGNDVWFSQWGSATTQANNLQIYGPGTYTQTWRTDTTVHIDTFFVEALLPQGNFFTNDTVPMAIGGSLVLNGPNGFAYLWNNNQISQSITVDTPGTYWLMITDESGCNRYDTVVVRYDSTVSTWQDWTEKEVEVFPNPAKDVFTINCKKTTNKINMQLYSSDGQLIKEADFNRSYTLDIADLCNGIYFIKIVDVERKRLPLVKKIIVQK
jgi:hypothetical protein